MPDRIKGEKSYIAKAIEVSELYEVDTKIMTHNSFVSVEFSFDSTGCMGFLKALVSMADDIAFFTGMRNPQIYQLIVQHFPDNG